MKKKKIVIIGSSGHLGFNVSKLLVKENKKILLLVRKKNIYLRELEAVGVTIKLVDFNKIDKIRKIIYDYDILINTASKNPYYPTKNILRDNYDITKKIFNATVNTKIKKIINISSSLIFKRKLNKLEIIDEDSNLNFFENDYVKGKILSEQFIDKFQICHKKIIIRIYPGWIIGNDDVYLTPPSKFFYERVFNKKIVGCFSGGISINGVKEVSEAIINSIKINNNERYILGGHNISYYDLIRLLLAKSKELNLIIKLPNFFLLIIKNLTFITSKYFNLFSNLSKQLIYSNRGLKTYLYLSSLKAKKDLNYKIKKLDSLINDIDINCKKHAYGITGIGKNNYFPKYKINLNNINKRKKILITGFPGQLGNRFIDFINKYNLLNKNKIYCNLLVEKKFKNLIKLPIQFNIFYGSLNDDIIIKKSLKDVNYVFHLASKIYETSTKELYKTNYIDSKSFITQLIKSKIDRVLFMSTDSVFGYESENKPFAKERKYTPYGAYGHSKQNFEIFLKEQANISKIKYTIIRSFLFFDKNLFNKSKLIKFVYNKIQPMIGNGNNYRNVSFKENIVLAFFHCLNSKKTINKSYWIGDKNFKITISQLYKKICKINKIKYRPIFLPNLFGKIFRFKFKILNFMGYNSGLLFTLSKLNLSITAKIDDIFKDTDYKEIINFKKIGNNEK